MGGMVALAYLGRPRADRPVEPTGLVLAATAAGRLTERGIPRLLANPATNILCGLAAVTPHRAISLLSKPVYAALALRCDADARSTLSRLFAETLGRSDVRRHRRRVPARPAVLRPALDARLDPRRDDRPQWRRRRAHPVGPRARDGRRHPRRHTRAPAEAGHMLLDEAAHAVTAAISRRHRHAHRRPPATRIGESHSRTTVFTAH